MEIHTHTTCTLTRTCMMHCCTRARTNAHTTPHHTTPHHTTPHHTTPHHTTPHHITPHHTTPHHTTPHHTTPHHTTLPHARSALLATAATLHLHRYLEQLARIVFSFVSKHAQVALAPLPLCEKHVVRRRVPEHHSPKDWFGPSFAIGRRRKERASEP
jgi:hypothetical protein